MVAQQNGRPNTPRSYRLLKLARLCGRKGKRTEGGFPNQLFLDSWKTGLREPVMLTKMMEEDRQIVLEVFDAAQSERGEP